MMNKILIFIFLVFSFHHFFSQNEVVSSNLTLVQSIMEDNFSPPQASRIHLYANVSSYEIYCLFQPKFRSIATFSHLQPIPKPTGKIIPHIAATTAFITTGKKFIYTEDLLLNHFHDQKQHWLKNYDTTVVLHSIEYGQKVANHILLWSNGDVYTQTRTMHRYELSDSLGAWKPTMPEYLPALEPNWFRIRQILLPKDSFVSFRDNVPYSESNTSECYGHAWDIYQTSRNLTDSQRNIALYWDDNPATNVSKGHAHFVIKKPTPMGHWLKITSQILSSQNESLENAALVYTMVSVAGFDAFINCWNVKYKTNAIRPETYIQRLIDPQFKPVIESPPFPEYTSGHSTISFAIARVLQFYYPHLGGFTDSSQLFLDMPPRRFSSFLDAARESSMSRFYGGIHYKPALNEGERMGRMIGEMTWRKFGGK